MSKKTVWHRLNVNYLSENYPDRALETSSPCKSIEHGLREFSKAITLERCSDDNRLPVVAELVKYIWDGVSTSTKTIVSNKEDVEILKMKLAYEDDKKRSY